MLAVQIGQRHHIRVRNHEIPNTRPGKKARHSWSLTHPLPAMPMRADANTLHCSAARCPSNTASQPITPSAIPHLIHNIPHNGTPAERPSLPSLPSLHSPSPLRRLAAGVRFVERLPRLAHGLVSLRLNGGNHLINIPIVGDLKLGCVVFLGDILRGMGHVRPRRWKRPAEILVMPSPMSRSRRNGRSRVDNVIPAAGR